MSVSSSADETKNDKLAVSVVREEAAAEDGTDDESSVGGSSGSGSRSGSGSVSGGMPLLHYKRLFGSSLPRRDDAVSTPITAMLMGKVILNAHTTHPKPDEPEENRSSHTTTNNNNASHHSANTTTATNSTASLNHPVEGQEIPVQQWQNKPVSIAVVGFQDGSVRLMDVCTGTSILGDPTVVWYPTDDHHHNTNTAQKAIVAVSLDASGTAIAAIDESGNCTVWTVKYSLQYRSAQPQQQPQPPQRPPSPPPLRPGNVLTKLFWKKETPPPTTRTMVTAADVVPGAAVELVPTLVLADVKVTRTTYPRKDFGTPTCLCLDPAYKNKLIVAFDGGKIVLSSRNWMRLDHAVLPYTGPLRDKDWKGIEAVTWRGSLLAFADCSGVKLYDLATLKPVAHVDRPTGARPSLYPGTTTVQAHICFETSRSLLVAWGDCLMALTVTDFMEHPRSTATAAVPDAPAAGTPVPPTRKRTVACTMAWGLDYVAMGVVPLDARHVAVLGLVPDSTEVDLQVIDRTNGFVVHSDLLALAQPKLIGKQSKTAGTLYNGRTNYMLLSSFAVPRQEDIVELKDEKGIDGDANLVAAIVSSVGGAKLEFVDSHLKWDLSMVSFNDDHDTEVNGGAVSGDTDSVDSDDYGFVLRNAESPGIAESAELVSPPLLLVASSSDVAVGRMRDVDDAIQFALEHKKMALALRRALPRVRQLRRYTVNDLINSYFRSVLRLTATDDKEKAQHLSLRRVKLAAKALPVLLGGNVDLWETWVSELERIPGALFVVKNFLPVRGTFFGSRIPLYKLFSY